MLSFVFHFVLENILDQRFPYKEIPANITKTHRPSLTRPVDGFWGLGLPGLVLEPLIQGVRPADGFYTSDPGYLENSTSSKSHGALEPHDNELQRAPIISYEELLGERRLLFQYFSI